MDNCKKNILISGGTGFLGKKFLAQLQSEKYDVVVLTRNSSVEKNLFRDFKVISNQDFLAQAIFQPFDLFVHMASDTRKQGVVLDSVLANIVFPLSIIRKIQNNHLKIINIDSTYYESEKNNYSITKKQFSELLFLETIPIMNFKIDNMYGIGDKSERLIPRILDRLIKNEPFIELTKGSQKRDFVDVQDVVALLEIAVAKILKSYEGYRSFDVGSGQPLSIKDAVCKLKDLSGNKTTELRFGAVDYSLVNENDLRSQIDIHETKEYFDWTPKMSLDNNINKIIECNKMLSI